MQQVRVKICGLTRTEDLLSAVSSGADALGFVFVPASKRCLEFQQAQELCRQVPAFVSRVGLFLDQPADFVRQALEQVTMNVLQFHGREGAEYCRQFGLPYIKAVSLETGESVAALEKGYPDAAAILVDSHKVGGLGGTGKSVDWSALQAGNRPLILAGGLKPENVAAAIKQVKPWAVDVSSGVEVSPGIKDAEAMKRFIREAKQ